MSTEVHKVKKEANQNTAKEEVQKTDAVQSKKGKEIQVDTRKERSQKMEKSGGKSGNQSAVVIGG